MKKSVPSSSQVPQSSSSESASRSLRQTGADGRSQSPLTQLARAINQSPRVQAQLKLAQEMQGSGQASSMAIQQKPMEKKKPAQGKFEGTIQEKGLKEKKPAQTKPMEKKKPVQGRFEDGAPLQEKRLDEKKPTQTKPMEKKKPVQGRFVDAAPTQLKAQLKEAPAPNRTGLPDQLKSGVESLSGISLDDVKVHYNSGKPAQLNALAYAQGTDIHVAPGQEQHLPHEAWHIVQQKQGRVQPTTQMKVGVPVNDDPGLEKEADVMGAQALQTTKDTDEQ